MYEKLTKLKAEYPQLSQAMTLAESGSPHASYLRVRGDYRTNGVQVQPAVLSVHSSAAGKEPVPPGWISRIGL